jgi:hypothetical protein
LVIFSFDASTGEGKITVGSLMGSSNAGPSI